MKKLIALGILILVVIVISSCAPGPNQLAGTARGDEETAGFWNGLWHGIIAPVTFIVSLFSDKVHIYEVHNSGGWYNFGFMLGMMIILGGGSGGAARRRRK